MLEIATDNKNNQTTKQPDHQTTLTSYSDQQAGLSYQLDSIVSDGDETTLVEVADGTLVGLFADLELLSDFLCTALVAKTAASATVLQIAKEIFREVFGMLTTSLLEGYIYLSVRTYLGDVCLHTVASVQITEHLGVIEQSRIAIVDDGFEAEVCLLPDEGIDFIAYFQRYRIVIDEHRRTYRLR